MSEALSPEAWERSRVGDLFDFKYGKALQKPKRRPGDVPVFSSAGSIDFHDAPLTDGPAIVIARKGVGVGDVFLSYGPCWVIDTALYAKVDSSLNAHFFTLQLESLGLHTLDQSSAIPGLNRSDLNRVEVVVPPRSVQDAIVAQAQYLISEITDAAKTAAEVEQLSSTLVASLAAAAVTGELAQPSGNGARGDDLLANLLVTRRAAWESKRLASMESKGSAPKDDRWKQKYPEPLAAHPDPTVPIPAHWTWATIDQIADAVQYGTSAKTNEDASGVPVLRMGNIQDGRLDLEKLKFLPANHEEFPGLLLHDGDLVFNRTNSPELVGKTAIFRGSETMSFASYLIRVQLLDGIVPEFVSLFINSPYGRRWVASVVSQQVGQANVNGSKLRGLSIPLPPTHEQSAIVETFEQWRLLGIEARVEGRQAVASAASLRHAILRAAFAGDLLKARSSAKSQRADHAVA